MEENNDKGINEIKNIQKEFFETLKSAQEEIVVIAASKYKEGDDIEDLLYDVTYDAIYEVLVNIDGYGNRRLNLDLIDKKSKVSLRTGIELHDICADYLKYEK